MAVDKNKIIAEATRLVQKGQYDKALKAYEKILAEDRKEVRILLKVGEIQQKKGDNASAAAIFNQVAEIYGDQGFFLKAVAVYKQIAKLTPEDIRVNEKLAGLYQQLGLLNDATSQLQVVATAHEKGGDQGKHLDVLRRLLDLDPENVVTCQRLGDLYAKAGRSAEALELYRRAASHLRENKRGDEYLKLSERIYQLTPDDLKLARELAQEYLARGDTKKALGKLQACHGADKQDVDTLRLMAQAFRDLGQVSKTIAVYRALARVYAERGRREEAALTWRQVLDLLPDDPEAAEELANAGGVRPSPAMPPPGRPPGAVGGPVSTPPPVRAVPPPRIASPSSAGPAAPSPASTVPPAVPAGSATPIGRLLTETDVYLKYGLHQKALDHVQKILAEDSENPDALERIRDIRDAMGNRQGAAEAAERAVQALLARGGEGRIEHAIERLRVLDPAHAEIHVEETPAPPAGDAEPQSVLEVVPAPADDELPPPDDEPPAEPAPGIAPLPTDDGEFLRPDGGAPETPTPAPLEAIGSQEPLDLTPPEAELERARALIPPEDQGPARVIDDERPVLVLDDLSAGSETAARVEPPAPFAPAAPPVDLEPGVGAAPAAEEVLRPDDAAELEDAQVLEVEIAPAELEEYPAAPLDAVAEQAIEEPPEAIEEPPEEVDVADLEELEVDEVELEPSPLPPPLPASDEGPLDAELEEVAFYEQQGLVDEAVLAVRELAAAHPGHPGVESARARIEALLAREEGSAPPPDAVSEPAPAEPEPPRPDGLRVDRDDRHLRPGRRAVGRAGSRPGPDADRRVPVLGRRRLRPVQERARADRSPRRLGHQVRPRHRLPGDGHARRGPGAVPVGPGGRGPPPRGGDPEHDRRVPGDEGGAPRGGGDLPPGAAVRVPHGRGGPGHPLRAGSRARGAGGARGRALVLPEDRPRRPRIPRRRRARRAARGGPGTPPDAAGHQASGTDGGGTQEGASEAARRPGRKNAGTR